MKFLLAFLLVLPVYATTTVSYFPNCEKEIKQSCSEKGTHVFYCLTQVIGRLGPKCSNDVQRQKRKLLKENPCFFDTFEYCKSTSNSKNPLDTYKCLRRYEHRVSAQCKEKLDADREKRRKANPCYDDIQKFCSKLEYGDAKVNDCLEKHQKKLQKKCVAQIENYKKKFPCYEDIRAHCPKVEKEQVNMCLIKKETKLKPKCKEHMKGFHQKYPCYVDVKTKCANKKGVNISLCLLQNENGLNGRCKKSMDEKRKIRPCYDELILYCRDVPKGMGRARECLKKNKKNLGKACTESIKKFENELPCLDDIKSHCSGNKNVNGCLESKVSILTPKCRAKVEKGIENKKKYQKFCGEDITKFCKGTKGRGSVVACLRSKKQSLSEKCIKGTGL